MSKEQGSWVSELRRQREQEEMARLMEVEDLEFEADMRELMRLMEGGSWDRVEYVGVRECADGLLINGVLFRPTPQGGYRNPYAQRRMALTGVMMAHRLGLDPRGQW
tara:strand:- start:5209 stop:5529 length:321 start_codon:yes stop_codon:yes gene_type:complete